MKKSGSKKTELDKVYLWSFFHAVLAAELVVALLLLILFGSIQTRSAQNYSVAQLEQVCAELDMLYDSLESVSYQILADRDTYPSFSSGRIDRLQEVKACIRLRTLKSSFPFFRYIGFYNAQSGRYLSNAYAGGRDDFDPGFIYERLGDENFIGLLRPIGGDYPLQALKNAQVYTFAFSLRLNGSTEPSLIILDVDVALLGNILDGMRVDGQNQQVIFTDQAGRLVSVNTAGQDSESFSPGFSSGADVSAIPRGAAGSGSQVMMDGMNINFATYASSQSMDWQVINIVPYGYILQGLWLVVLLSLLLLAISLLFGYIISKRTSVVLYRPIQRLYDRFIMSGGDSKMNELEQLNEAFSDMYARQNQPEQGLINSYNLSRHQYLTYLLEGEIERIEQAANIYERLRIRLDSPFYMAAVIKCVLRSAPEGGLPAGSNFFVSHYALENITVETVSARYGMAFIQVKEGIFAVLLYLPEARVAEDFTESLRGIVKVMRQEFSMDTSICLGGLAGSWKNINTSYEQAMAALTAGTGRSTGDVFYYSDGMLEDSAKYFENLHEKFAERIRAGDINSCGLIFDEALRVLNRADFQGARNYFSAAAKALLETFASCFEEGGEPDRELPAQNVRELRRGAMDFFAAILRRYETAPKTGKEEVVERMKKYAEEHYSDSGLSLGVLADWVGLTPAYVGKMFAFYTGAAFNDYLTRIRMDKAAELLAETDRTVNQISEAVGIVNTNYFYALFKKHYHMTPVKYREGQTKRLPR